MKKIITYGTFDLFHQGHYNIIKRARDLGDYLIVGVTSESYDIERGKLNVKDSLASRIESVRATGLADEIIIEEYQGQKIHDIIKYNIDVLVVGSDWIGKFDYLREYCEVVYLERTKNISSTMIRESQKINKIGVITDELDDGGFILESKFISGMNVEKVYAEDPVLAENFCVKHQLDSFTTEIEDFFRDIEIVYLNVAFEKREKYASLIIENKKHILSPVRVFGSVEKTKEFLAEGEKQHILVVSNIIMGYLRAFTQLVWLLRCGLIGKIIRIRCTISQKEFVHSSNLEDILTYPVFLCLKILGMDYQSDACYETSSGNNSVLYKKIIQYEDSIADIEVCNLDDIKSGVSILGTDGRVEIPDDWWNMGYFEVFHSKTKQRKRYCYNFEGNGVRYMLQEMMIMLQDKRKGATRIFPDEIIKINEMVNSADNGVNKSCLTER